MGMTFPAASRLAPVTALASVDSTFDVVDAEAPNLATWATLDQRAGRGRLGREWVAPAGRCLAASIVLRPDAEESSWGWLPLAVGLAVTDAVAPFVAGRARIKWPNDVLIDGRKVAGILCERRGAAVVAGVGVNLTLERDELPVETATSLALEGAEGTAEALADAVLHDVLAALGDMLPRLDHAATRAAIAARCVTLESRVRVLLPGEATIEGVATGLAAGGELEVTADDGTVHRVAAGDVTHVR